MQMFPHAFAPIKAFAAYFPSYKLLFLPHHVVLPGLQWRRYPRAQPFLGNQASVPRPPD
jgi:hypothetical protein